MTVAAVLGAVALVALAANLLSMAIAAFRIGPISRPSALLDELPPVTIVRPVRGLEAHSRETLTSGLLLDYPDVRTIFCVADGDDPIIPLLDEIITRQGRGRARVIVGDVAVSANPKLNNCVRGWEAAETDWVVLADSNVLMPPDYVQRLMAAWRPTTGLVCSTPAGSRPQGFWAEVECAFLNTYQARWQYTGEALGFGFAQGKSMLWNKPFLDRQGGIAALAAEIAEDAAATKLVNRAGRKVHLVGAPFEQPLGPRGLFEVAQRQFRWARLRRVTFLPFFVPEILSAPLAPALLLAFAAPAFGVSAWLGALAVFLPWYAVELLLARKAGWFLSWRSPFAFLARDLMFPAIWAYAFVGGEVTWRGNAMRIGSGGDSALNEQAPALSAAPPPRQGR
jgi:ceramide glucosyltransferase